MDMDMDMDMDVEIEEKNIKSSLKGKYPTL
jgi:hypothetical protein